MPVSLGLGSAFPAVPLLPQQLFPCQGKWLPTSFPQTGRNDPSMGTVVFDSPLFLTGNTEASAGHRIPVVKLSYAATLQMLSSVGGKEEVKDLMKNKP